MASVKRILVGLRGTPAAPVKVRRAIELARRFDASVTAVSILDTPSIQRATGPVPRGGLAAARALEDTGLRTGRAQLDAAVELFERECARAGVRHRVRRGEGAPSSCSARSGAITTSSSCR